MKSKFYLMACALGLLWQAQPAQAAASTTCSLSGNPACSSGNFLVGNVTVNSDSGYDILIDGYDVGQNSFVWDTSQTTSGAHTMQECLYTTTYNTVCNNEWVPDYRWVPNVVWVSNYVWVSDWIWVSDWEWVSDWKWVSDIECAAYDDDGNCTDYEDYGYYEDDGYYVDNGYYEDNGGYQDQGGYVDQGQYVDYGSYQNVCTTTPETQTSCNTALTVTTGGAVMGVIDGITVQGDTAYVSGWACAEKNPNSLAVHLYADAPAGQGTILAQTSANLASEPGVAAACGSTGANYRFKIPVDAATVAKHPGEPVYVYGISPDGRANNALYKSGSYYLPGERIGDVMGVIDSFQKQSNGSGSVTGWACAQGSSTSIDVSLSVGSTVLKTVTANLASEAAVAKACGATGKNYRYSIPVDADAMETYAAQAITVKGISPNGKANNSLFGSGKTVFPGQAVGPVIGVIDTVSQSGTTASITGWACAKNSSKSIKVHTYLNAAYGASGAMYYGESTANLSSESAVAAACASTGSAYRFKIDVDAATLAARAGQAIYVYGISPTSGVSNALLANSGKKVLPGKAAGPVMGVIDSAKVSGSTATVSGWACAQGSNASINVHLYLGGAIVKAATANLASEAAVAAACGASGSAYRYSLSLDAATTTAHLNQTVAVYGISPNGGANNALAGSGKLTLK